MADREDYRDVEEPNRDFRQEEGRNRDRDRSQNRSHDRESQDRERFHGRESGLVSGDFEVDSGIDWDERYNQGFWPGGWSKSGPYTGLGPKGYQRGDERILDEVNDQLMWHGHIDARDIHVEVSQGDVTLSGSVKTRREKHLSVFVAESVMGVRDVFNHLRVEMREEGAGPRYGEVERMSRGASVPVTGRPGSDETAAREPVNREPPDRETYRGQQQSPASQGERAASTGQTPIGSPPSQAAARSRAGIYDYSPRESQVNSQASAAGRESDIEHPAAEKRPGAAQYSQPPKPTGAGAADIAENRGMDTSRISPEALHTSGEEVLKRTAPAPGSEGATPRVESLEAEARRPDIEKPDLTSGMRGVVHHGASETHAAEAGAASEEEEMPENQAAIPQTGDPGAQAVQPAKSSPVMQPEGSTLRFRIREGMEVIARDGERVGMVKEVRSGDFLVDRPMARDIYIPISACELDAGKVIIQVPANEVSHQGWQLSRFF